MSGADEGHGGPPPGRHHAQDESRPPVRCWQAQRCAQLVSRVCRGQDGFLPGVLSTKFLSSKQTKYFSWTVAHLPGCWRRRWWGGWSPAAGSPVARYIERWLPDDL